MHNNVIRTEDGQLYYRDQGRVQTSPIYANGNIASPEYMEIRNVNLVGSPVQYVTPMPRIEPIPPQPVPVSQPPTPRPPPANDDDVHTLSIAAMVASSVALILLIAVVFSASRNTLIARDMSWSTLYLPNRTMELGLQTYTSTDNTVGITTAHRYEAEQSCDTALVPTTSNIRLCHECEQSGDGISALIWIAFITTFVTVLVLAAGFHSLNSDTLRVPQLALLMSVISFFCTFISVIWWATICHRELEEVDRSLNAGWYICMILALLHFSVVVLTIAELRRRKRRLEKGPSSISSMGVERYEITGQVRLSDMYEPSQARRGQRGEDQVYEGWIPANPAVTNKIALHWPHVFADGEHKVPIQVATVLSTIILLLSIVPFWATSDRFEVLNDVNMGRVTVAQSSGIDMEVYIGLGTIGFYRNFEGQVHRYPNDEAICFALRQEVSNLDPNNCIDAVGCSSCADTIQWAVALYAIAFVAIIFNTAGSIYRLYSNSRVLRATTTICSIISFITIFTALMMTEYDCLRMLTPPDGNPCPTSSPQIDRGGVFGIFIVLILFLFANGVLQYITGHQIIINGPVTQQQARQPRPISNQSSV